MVKERHLHNATFGWKAGKHDAGKNLAHLPVDDEWAGA